MVGFTKDSIIFEKVSIEIRYAKTKDPYTVTLLPRLKDVWVYNPVKANMPKDNIKTNRNEINKVEENLGRLDLRLK